MLEKDAVALLSQICRTVEGDRYAVYDWSDIFPDGYGEKEQEAWKALLRQGCVDVKYSDDDSVCFCVTYKGRNINEELATLQVSSDENNTVVRTDAAGRPVMVVKNDDKFIGHLKKTLHSKSISFVWGLVGGFIGGLIGGAIIAIIMHFAA